MHFKELTSHCTKHIATKGLSTIRNKHCTLKPVLSGHPLLSGKKPKSPNLFSLFTLNETFIKRKPLLSVLRHLHVKVPEMVISKLLPTCIKRTLVIEFHHPTCQTPEMGKIATHK